MSEPVIPEWTGSKDGRIRKEYYVHCPSCQKPLLGLAGTYDRAVKELRHAGWKLRKGLWMCPKCD